MCENEGLYNKLIGALIGLARATDGNEHLINPSATTVVVESLMANQEDASVLNALLSRVEEEKRKMVPDCFFCANPCGRTSDFDLAKLDEADAETRVLKNRILFTIRHMASAYEKYAPSIFYSALIVIGMDDFGTERLISFVNEIDTLDV